MYGSLTRVNAQNAKSKLADSYAEILREITSPELKSIGNYTIQRLLGEGSFGKVYLAVHKFTKTRVVLKGASRSDPQLVREIHHHRLFKHPHVARLYEFIITETKVWLVLEYCPGDDLYSYLIKNVRLSQDETKKLIAQLTGAVAYIHSHNCVHRDLKLENILLDKHDSVKLADFGFTREYTPRNMLETVCGTTCYMAPEMLLHKKYSGEAVDVWSLGVIFYTLLFGEMPFEEETDLDTKLKIINEDPRYPDPEVIGAPLSLVQSMLSKDPRTRPSIVEILNNSWLDKYAIEQRDILERKISNPFSTRAEKRLLRALRAAHIDVDRLTESVLLEKCDSMAGLWALSLRRELKYESKRSHRSSISISKYSLTRRDSTNSKDRTPLIKALGRRSLSAPRTPASPSNRLTSWTDNNLHPDAKEEAIEFLTPNPRLDRPKRTLSKSKSTGVLLHSYGQGAEQVVSPAKSFTNGSVDKRKQFSTAFKNAFLRMVKPSKKIRNKHSTTGSLLSNIKDTVSKHSLEKESPGSQSKSVTKIEDFNEDPTTNHYNEQFNISKDVSNYSDKDYKNINTNTQDETNTNFRQHDQLLTPVHKSSKPRPISQISNFSQISSFSQLSSAPSNLSQDLSPSDISLSNLTLRRRPYLSRTSTSSSFSSLHSDKHKSRRHQKSRSKASSISSTASIHSRSPSGRTSLDSSTFDMPVIGSNDRVSKGDRKGKYTTSSSFPHMFSGSGRSSPFSRWGNNMASSAGSSSKKLEGVWKNSPYGSSKFDMSSYFPEKKFNPNGTRNMFSKAPVSNARNPNDGFRRSVSLKKNQRGPRSVAIQEEEEVDETMKIRVVNEDKEDDGYVDDDEFEDIVDTGNRV